MYYFEGVLAFFTLCKSCGYILKKMLLVDFFGVFCPWGGVDSPPSALASLETRTCGRRLIGARYYSFILFLKCSLKDEIMPSMDTIIVFRLC